MYKHLFPYFYAIFKKSKTKKMKKVFVACASLLVMASVVAFTPTQKGGEPVNFAVNTKESKVDFSGSKKAGFHPGYFPVKDGNVAVTNGKISGGKFTIDVTGIKVTDGAGEKLEGHLKTPDFLDAAKFSDAVFEITSVNYSDANTAQIAGSLTLKGVKAEIKFDAKVREVSETKLFAEAFFSLDRTKYGILYGAGMISNDVQIGVHLFAGK
jgi:polyisoprenoid-binding protein YceI